MSVRFFHLIAVAALFGCASTAGKSGPTSVTSKANFLGAEEIANAYADARSAYDAIARLRPNWLAARGVTSLVDGGAGTDFAVVFVDGQRYGDLQSLRQIQAYQVGSAQYYDVTQAGANFGIRGGSSGVIEIKMKGPSTYPP
jgi:hypothetical protein